MYFKNIINPLQHTVLVALCIIIVRITDANQTRLNYLELRDINYDFASKYKDHLNLLNSREFQASQLKMLQYKKKYNDFLMRLPNSDVRHNPNGYFSDSTEVGFNPLQQKSVNNLYGAKPFIQANPNDKQVFMETEDVQSQSLPIDSVGTVLIPASYNSLPSVSNFDLEVYKQDVDGLPMGDDMSQEDRFNRAVKLYNEGLNEMHADIQNLYLLLEKYEKEIQSDTNTPALIELTNRVSEAIEMTREKSSFLGLYGANTKDSASQNNLDSSAIDQSLDQKLLYDQQINEVQSKFEAISIGTGNPYALLSDAEMQNIFQGNTAVSTITVALDPEAGPTVSGAVPSTLETSNTAPLVTNAADTIVTGITPTTASPIPTTASPTPTTASPIPTTASPTPTTASPTPKTASPTPKTASPTTNTGATTKDNQTTQNPLGPPVGNTTDDGVPPADLDISSLPPSDSSAISKLPTWLEGFKLRMSGVTKILFGGAARFMSGGMRGQDTIDEGRALLQKADKIQRAAIEKYYKSKQRFQQQ